MSSRKPRRPRWPAIINAMAVAQDRATILDPSEVDTITRTIAASAQALREGTATLLQWSIVAGAIDFAHAIERQGVVRGMHEHFASADAALKSIHTRATQAGPWKPTALHYFEIDAMQTFLGLHEFQLRKLSMAEYRRAAKSATGSIRGAGNKCTVQKILTLSEHT